MYRLRKQFKFEAAHQLEGHDGKCARLHGHSWVGYVELEGVDLEMEGPKEGMLMDYYDINVPLKKLVDKYLDHYSLNETLAMRRPTSEKIAKWVYDQLEPIYHKDSSYHAVLVAVFIEETCTSSAEYRP